MWSGLSPRGKARVLAEPIRSELEYIQRENNMGLEKPTLGVIPEKIWKENRLKDLNEAIIKRTNSFGEIPQEWITERNKLACELDPSE